MLVFEGYDLFYKFEWSFCGLSIDFEMGFGGVDIVDVKYDWFDGLVVLVLLKELFEFIDGGEMWVVIGGFDCWRNLFGCVVWWGWYRDKIVFGWILVSFLW